MEYENNTIENAGDVETTEVLEPTGDIYSDIITTEISSEKISVDISSDKTSVKSGSAYKKSDTFEPMVLFEDNHVLVVVKPQNLLSQGDTTGDEDLLSLLKSYIKHKYNKPGQVFLGLVHRLDRPTGGVMVFARTSKAAERLSEQLREGDVSKKYLAIVGGVPKLGTDRLVHYLKKDHTTNTVVLAPATTEGAKKCILDYKTLETTGKYSLVDIKLVTGRSHQIRAQFKAIGHPLLGDVRYGGNKASNLALWAYELRFNHPTTKKSMVFRVFPPEDTSFKHFNVDRYINIYRPE